VYRHDDDRVTSYAVDLVEPAPADVPSWLAWTFSKVQKFDLI
jgi:hypothetical protein